MGQKSLVKERNPLDWYSLTERTNSILNGIIAFTGRESYLESKKGHPDQSKLAEWRKLSDEVKPLIRNSDNFDSKDRMEELINHYSPILRAANKIH